MVLIDAYPKGGYSFQNVGVDDYSGGYQIGEYLYSCGYHRALFVAETEQDSDYARWLGFKQAMEKMAASAAAHAMWWFPRNPGAD